MRLETNYVSINRELAKKYLTAMKNKKRENSPGLAWLSG